MFNITATALSRFMVCNGSRLMGGVPSVDEDNQVRDEGNAVHWMIEQVFKGVMTAEEHVDRKAPNGVYITPSMVEHAQAFLEAIQGQGGHVEHDTSHSDLNGQWRVGGRADHILWQNNILYVDDFKYGWKIVSPKENWTLVSHAYSMIKLIGVWPKKIVFRIFQPRPYHPDGYVREWCIDSEMMKALCDDMINALDNPSDKLNTSEHCYKCPSRTQCPAAQIAIANSIDVSESVYDNEIDNDILAEMINNMERASKVLKESIDAYTDLALLRLKQGQVIKGFGLAAELGNLEWKEGLTPDVLKLMTGVDLSKLQLVTPTQAKKLGVNIDALCERRNKGVKIVRMDASKNAEKLFGKKG